MPARLGGIAAHAFGDEAKPRGPARLGRELQPTPFGQAKRLTEFEDDKIDAAVAQGFLCRGQNIHLISRLGDQKLMRIDEARQPDRVEPLLPPAFAEPEEGAFHACARNRSEPRRPRPADLMNASAAQGECALEFE